MTKTSNRLELTPGLAPRALHGTRVLLLTTGHIVTDHRIYDKLARSLRDLGAQVCIVGPSDDSRILDHDIQVLPVSRSRSRLVRFMWQPLKSFWVARRCRSQLVHFHDPEMLLVLPLMKFSGLGSKFIYDVHEDFENLVLIRDWLPAFARKAIAKAVGTGEKAMARIADAVIGVTPQLTAKFTNRCKATAYNFPSANFFRATKGYRRRHLLRPFDLVHVGTLSAHRAMFLTKVLREYHRLRPHARSLVVGLSPMLEARLRPLVPENCVLQGKIPYTQIPHVLVDAKVGLSVHPWLENHLRVAFPVKVSEYMAAGCGVVCSSLPVLNGILSKVGRPKGIRIVDSQDPLDYAHEAVQLVKMLETDEGAPEELRSYVVSHMNWENEAHKVATLYLGLLKR